PTPRSTLFPYTTLFRSCTSMQPCEKHSCRAIGVPRIGTIRTSVPKRKLHLVIHRSAKSLKILRSVIEQDSGSSSKKEWGQILNRSEEHTSELQSLRHLV